MAGTTSGNGSAWKWIATLLAGLLIGSSAQWVAYVKDAMSVTEAKAMRKDIEEAENTRHILESKTDDQRWGRVEDALAEIKTELAALRKQ
jgi:hypothetical protein